MRTFLEYLAESSILLLENAIPIGYLGAKGYGSIEIISTNHDDIRQTRTENEIPVTNKDVLETINYCLKKVLEDLEAGKIRYSPDHKKEILIRDHREGKSDLNIVYGLYLGVDKDNGWQNKIKAITTMKAKDFPSLKNWSRTYDIKEDGSITIGNWNKSYYAS